MEDDLHRNIWIRLTCDQNRTLVSLASVHSSGQFYPTTSYLISYDPIHEVTDDNIDFLNDINSGEVIENDLEEWYPILLKDGFFALHLSQLLDKDPDTNLSSKSRFDSKDDCSEWILSCIRPPPPTPPLTSSSSSIGSFLLFSFLNLFHSTLGFSIQIWSTTSDDKENSSVVSFISLSHISVFLGVWYHKLDEMMILFFDQYFFPKIETTTIKTEDSQTHKRSDLISKFISSTKKRSSSSKSSWSIFSSPKVQFCFKMFLDVILGLILIHILLLPLLLSSPHSSKSLNFIEDNHKNGLYSFKSLYLYHVRFIQRDISWFSMFPGGLKLNSPLVHLMGKVVMWIVISYSNLVVQYGFSSSNSFYVLIPSFVEERFHPKNDDPSSSEESNNVFIEYNVCWLILISWSLGGCSGILGLMIDCGRLLTLHISTVHRILASFHKIQIDTISSLWLLLRGKKRNMLRNERIDSCPYDLNRILVGTCLFTTLIFIFPTFAVFYTFFTLLKGMILMVNFSVGFIICLLVKLNFVLVNNKIMKKQRKAKDLSENKEIKQVSYQSNIINGIDEKEEKSHKDQHHSKFNKIFQEEGCEIFDLKPQQHPSSLISSSNHHIHNKNRSLNYSLVTKHDYFMSTTTAPKKSYLKTIMDRMYQIMFSFSYPSIRSTFQTIFWNNPSFISSFNQSLNCFPHKKSLQCD